MEKHILKVFVTVTVLLGLLILSSVPAYAQASLYKDNKANQVGDIITVILVENISGSSTSDSRKSSNADGGASGSVSGNFLPFEPTFGSDVNVNYGSDERNSAGQRQLLEGHMSVRIIEVTPSGDLIVEGTRKTEINSEIHEMNLTGTVRPGDVDTNNQVLSYRVANADISYQKQGGLDEIKQRRGFIKRVVFAGVGVLLGAVIITREFN